ncbi:MAG: diguanylate cyclase [Comamonadaceae bacterium]|nr:MAG: diguanylate cyclase [Comamonadaceae bacterium]
MSIRLSDPDTLVALGAFLGAQVLVVCLAVIIANAYRERALLFHAAATVMAILALQLHTGASADLSPVPLLLALGFAGLQLRDVVNHAGALRQPRRWLVAVSLGLLPLVALVSAMPGRPQLLLPALAAWVASASVVLLRAWPQSQPWAAWLVAGLVSLAFACGLAGWHAFDGQRAGTLSLAALLTVWSACVYLATVWRSRLFSETRVRVNARTTVDPLTGLATMLVFNERVRAARSLIKRYAHPSVLLLVHIENLDRLAQEFGPEVAESAVLVAANRIRDAIGDGGVAARLSHARIAVLAEGASVAEGTSTVASRILVAGLKEPLPTAPTEFLQFRVVVAAVPIADVPGRAALQQMGVHMDAHLLQPAERRIHVLAADALSVSVPDLSV